MIQEMNLHLNACSCEKCLPWQYSSVGTSKASVQSRSAQTLNTCRPL